MLTKDNDYLQLRKNKATLVRNILDEVILDVCKRENCFIITSYINIFSFDLIAEGVRPKPYYVTQRTEKDGVLAGYVLEESNKHRKNKHNSFEYLNITTPLTVSNNALANQKALYSEGNLVTADLDVVLVARKPPRW